jgi:hypothetical protein
VGLVACAVAATGALAVRAQQRGITHYQENLADAFVTWATFGIASAGAGAIRSLGELEKELAVSGGAFVATRGTVELAGLISSLAGCTISHY